jgi:cellulose synthase/poly-beta-1,6-N-acetylglucosamine synthase-like glycosyltransferase
MSHLMDLFFLLYFVILNSVQTLLFAMSVLEIIKRRAGRIPEFDAAVMSEEATPPITIVAPAYNESATIVDSVRAFLQLQYPNLQVIVVNDGSQDDTMELLKERFDLHPINLVVRRMLETRPMLAIYRSAVDQRLTVVDKENGGKADALNVGLNVCRTPLICCVDSDTLVARDALLRMLEALIYDNQNAVAVGGTVRLANGCKVQDGIVTQVGVPRSWLARFQMVEYLRAFLYGRMGLNRWGGNLIISGAFGLFFRQTLLNLGGFERGTVGEDMELIVRIHRKMREDKKQYRVVQMPEPVCYTEAPEKLSILSKQRDRWQRGLFDSLWRHKTMLFNPRYGIVGMVVFPFFLFFELLGPIIELGGYVWFAGMLAAGSADWRFAVLFFFAAFVWGFFLSLLCLVLDDLDTHTYRDHSLRIGFAAAAFLENFGYRQVNLFFRLKGLVRYVAGEKAWGRMTRKGFRS